MMKAAACVTLLCCAQAAGAADSIRTAVPIPAAQPCDAPTSIAALAQTYYQQPLPALTDSVVLLLNSCRISSTIQTRYAVIIFAAKPTPAAKPVVVHLLFDASNNAVLDRSTMLGAGAATWVYLTDDVSNKVVVQLVTTPTDNPLLGQLGKLASTVVPKFRAGAVEKPPKTFPIGFSVSGSIALPAKRATIAESDNLSEGTTLIEGSATFNNQPRTWLTLNAGAGFFAGKKTGDTRAKIDSKIYVSDPLPRVATFAGMTFHAPFDASLPSPSVAERCGAVLAAMLTPAPGVYAGATCGWRGLSLTAGWSEMWINVPPPPKQVNDPVEGQEQLTTGRSGRILISLMYAFGG